VADITFKQPSCIQSILQAPSTLQSQPNDLTLAVFEHLHEWSIIGGSTKVGGFVAAWSLIDVCSLIPATLVAAWSLIVAVHQHSEAGVYFSLGIFMSRR
jgi:hypothetical protein